MGDESIKNKTQKLFIEPLEQRIMLDGAGASTFLDLIDERNQQQIKINSSNKDIYKEGENSNKDIPFTNITRDKIRNDKKNIVFIDSAVEDYETITSSFKENTEFYLINSNEDGFKRISEILKDKENIDALHLIGHGSSGQILFGNAFLNNDNIDNYKSTLTSIGQSLTTSGDILFYGCNVASTEQGEILIKKISEITKADIAASDDITGKSGDWELEKKIGIVETENVKFTDLNTILGITNAGSNTTELADNANVSLNHSTTRNSNRYYIALEEENISISGSDYISEINPDVAQTFHGNNSNGYTNLTLRTLNSLHGESSATVDSYILVYNFDSDGTFKTGNVTFDEEILGVFVSSPYTHNTTSKGSTATAINNLYSSSSLTYGSYSSPRVLENSNGNNGGEQFKINTSSFTNKNDEFSISNNGGTNNYLRMRFNNSNGGDYLRIIVRSANTAPTASDGTVYINENNQVSSAGDRTPSNITKVFAASDFNFSDSDGDSLSKIQITSLESSGDLEYSTNGSTWSDVTTNLEISAANLGSGYLRFTPAANSESDVTFGFKVHDGTAYSSSAYTMNISVNAAPNVSDVTHAGNVAAGATTSSADIHGVINSTDTVADSDDADSVLVVTGVAAGNESTNNTIITDDTGVGGDGIDGTYGTLTVAADGTYTYTASPTNNIAYNSTATDTFTFTTRDDEGSSGSAGSHAYDVGTITFTVASSISLSNDDDTATEGTPITVTGSDDDVLNDDTADTDGLVVTNISHSNGSESVSSGTTYSNGASLTGDYGTLVIGADGSYTFTPNDVLGASETGTDVFTYTADGATATLSIEVTGINDAPVSSASSVTTNEDTNHVFSTEEFNFSDDDNSNSLNKIKITSLEDNGALQYYNGSTWVDVTENQEITAADITSGYLRFNPDANENGDDYTSFEFQVSDGTAYSSSSSTMTINVTPVNDDPTARNDTGTVNEDAELDVDDGDDLTPVTAASYSDSDSFTIAGSDSSPATTQNRFEDMIFNDDGTKMYVLGYESGVAGKNLFQYTLSTPFDVSTASVSSDDYISVGLRNDNNEAIRFNNDGTKLFVLADSTGQNVTSYMHQYTLSTPYDITSTVTEGTRKTLGTSSTDNFRSFLFNDDGSKMFVSRGLYIYEYTLSTSFDTSTASSPDNSFYVTNSSYGLSNYGSSHSITGMQYNKDGTKLFTVHQLSTIGHTAKIVEWSLSTAYDPTTASTDADFNDTSTYFETGDATTASLSPTHFITFNNDGSKFFSFSDHAVFGDTLKIKEWNVSSPFNLVNVSGEHSGDVIDTSSTDNYDTDPDGDALTVTDYSHTSATDEDGGSISSTSSTGTAGTNNVTGYYGTLDLEGDGSYTYTADLTATQALDAGDTVTDVFTYTVDDGNGGTDTATITITVNGMNDAPTAVADTDSVDAGSTVTDEDGEGTLVSDDTDPDASSSLYVTKITGNGNTSNVTYNSTKISNAATIVGSKGTLTFGSDGSYSYAADSDATSGDDVFTYTLTDGTSTSTATLTISVTEVANNAPTAADNAVTTNEDTDHTFSASEFGFTDVDSDSLDHVTIETLPTEGTLLLDGSAVSAGDEIAAADITNLVFRPAANENGDDYDSFTFSVNDGTVDSASPYTMTVNVTAVNDAPTAADNAVTTNEDTDHTFSASEFGFTDVDSDSLDHVTIETLPTEGTLLLDGSAVSAGDEIAAADITNLVFRPAANENGDDYDSFTFSVNDGTVDSASPYTMTVNVTAVNDAPTAADNAVTTNEDTDHTFSASEFGFTDVDSDSLDHVTIETLPSEGTLLLDGVAVSEGDEIAAADITNLVFRPAANENGDDYDSFTFSVNDGTVDSASPYTMTVNVTAVNDAPTADDDTINVAAGTPATGNVITSSDTDPDGDSLTVSAIAEGDVGSPITGTYGTFTLNSGGSYTYTVDTLNADVIAWQSGDPALTETFTYTVSDGNGGTNTATITVNVSGQNDAPTADDNAVTTNEDTDHTFDASEFNFTDLDGDSLDHISIETLPSKGTLLLNGVAVTLGQNIPAADISTLVFRPAANANGASYDSFTFSVNDGTVDSGTYTMTVNVTAVNDAPVSSASSVTTNEDTTYTFTADDFSFTDEEGDTLSSVTVSALSGSDGTFLLNGVAITGSTTVSKADIDANLLTFVPDANENGSSYNTFTFTVNDGTTDSGSSTMTVNVTAVNDAPTITADTENDFTEGSTNSGDPVSVFNISDSETSNSNLELSISNTTYYSITNNNDGTATVTLTSDGADYVNAGNDLPSYTVTVTDESNATATASHNPSVTTVNDAPTITATTENDFVEGSASENDTVGIFDVDDEDTADGSLVVTIVSGNDNGYYEISYDDAGTATVTLTSDGADYVNAGNDLPEYTVQVSDGSLTTTTSHNPTTLDNTKPEASDNTVTTLEDTSYTFSSNDFGFTDDDGNTLSSVTVSSLGTNGNGTFTLNGVAISGSTTVTKAQIDNGLLKFTPSSGDNGSSYNTYTFTVNDGTDDSSSSYTMTINVTAVNDAPVATDDASSVDEDSRVRVSKNGDDLLNDDSDPENDSLKVTLIKVLGGSNNSISNGSSTTITGTYGQLTVNSNGGYTYRANQDAADTLDTGESAEEKFVYTVSDGNGGTDTGILTITINGVEDNPNAVKDNVSLNISENSTLTGNAITNDIDPDDSLTIVGCGQGQNPNNGTPKTVGTAFNSNYGQMTINADGTYTFVAASNINDLLDPGQSVTERFYYTISDGNSTSTAMIEVTVQRDNVVQELTRKEQKQIKKQIANERLNQPSTIRLLNNTTPAKTIEQTANALDNISNTKKLSFNEGIKLVDLVAETGSLTTTDGSLDKVRAKEKDGQLNLKFKVSTDLGNQAVRYEGVMPDGSKLPDWIKVDPQTGKTTTNIPEGVEQVDFTIIVIDQQNNKKEIAVSIDPKEIREDKSIFKQAKKQNASLSVDQSGNVNIVNTNESGEVNQTETKNLNANEKQNSSNNIITRDLNLDNTNDIKNIIDTIKSDQVYQLQTINNGETLEIKVPETLLGNFEKTKLVLKDGSAIPDWVEFDPITGEINANPPEDVDKLEFKLIIERDGEIIVKDLAVDVGGDDNAQILDDIENAKFIAFKDQLNKEHENWEEYGSNIINRL